MKNIIMGIITLLAAGILFLQLGALTQGTARPALLIVAAAVSIASIFYWERRRA